MTLSREKDHRFSLDIKDLKKQKPSNIRNLAKDFIASVSHADDQHAATGLLKEKTAMSWTVADACNTNTGKAEAEKLTRRPAWPTHTAPDKGQPEAYSKTMCVRMHVHERQTEGKTEKDCVGHIIEACYLDYIQALAQKQNFRSCFVLVLEIEHRTSNILLPLARGPALEKKCANMGFFFMFTVEPDFCLRTLK